MEVPLYQTTDYTLVDSELERVEAMLAGPLLYPQCLVGSYTVGPPALLGKMTRFSGPNALGDKMMLCQVTSKTNGGGCTQHLPSRWLYCVLPRF